MKTNLHFLSRLAPLAGGLLTGLAMAGWTVSCGGPKVLVVPSVPPDMLPSQAQVAELRGPGIRALKPGGSWQKLKLGDWLPIGATVQTPPGSSLVLRLYEAGVIVQLKPDGQLRLNTLSFRHEGGIVLTATRLDLQKGEVAVDGSNLSPGSEFEIRTPQGVTRIPPGGGK